MNSYLGNKAGKIKKTSYLWLVVCAIFAASAGSVLIDYIRSGKEALDIVLAILMTGLFIWPIVRIIRNILFCRSAQKIAGWFYYYEEDEVRFEKLEKCYQELTDQEKAEEKTNILNALNFARKVIATQECDFLLLDEILGLLDYGITTEEAIGEILKMKDESMHILLTGRTLPEGLRKYADSITTLTTELLEK